MGRTIVRGADLEEARLTHYEILAALKSAPPGSESSFAAREATEAQLRKALWWAVDFVGQADKIGDADSVLADFLRDNDLPPPIVDHEN